MSKLEKALELLDRFERGDFSQPSHAESLLVEVFEACGSPVTEKGFIESTRNEVDCFVRAKVAGKLQTIAVEIKAGANPAGVESVRQAFSLKNSGPFDRAMVISRLGFSAEALQHANTVGLGEIDLFGPRDLRNWLSKQIETQDANAI
jgi:Restriction endonuclease